MNFNEELGELTEALRDGTIEDAQVARLDEILAESPGAVEQFVDLALLRADLDARLGGRAPSALPVPRRPRRRWILAGAAAAAVVLAATSALLVRSTPSPETPLRYEGCAVLARALDARWGGSPPPVGSALPMGVLALKSGVIQVEFFSGARVVLEGPAELELVSTNEARCTQGRLRAFVPPYAHGFTVRTPTSTVTDRGTEFGLRVDAREGTEVHVFQGRVDVDSGAQGRGVSAGEALRIDPSGQTRPIAASPEAFVSVSDLNVRSSEEARSRFARWGDQSEKLRRDPRVAVYYSFSDAPEWTRELRSQKAGRSPLDGSIIGCRWAEGRWNGKKSLEFKGPGDRVRFQDAGEYGSITLMTWVRVDALDRPFSGLMLTDGWTSGSVHWQITQAGALRLGIHGEKQWTDYDAPAVFAPGRFGRWVHLCTVYDREARQVVHYVDGLPVRRLPLRFDSRLQIWNAELGNWGVPVQGTIYEIRNLNGRMDEFALFGQALGAAEIAELYAAGAPAP